MFPDIDIKSFISLFASCTTTHQVSKFPPTSHRFLSILHLFIHPWFWNNLPVENSCFFFYNNNNNKNSNIYFYYKNIFYPPRNEIFRNEKFYRNRYSVHWKIILSPSPSLVIMFRQTGEIFRKPLLDETKGREWWKRPNNSIPGQKGGMGPNR